MKKRIYEIIELAEEGDKLSKCFDISIIVLIVLNTLAIVLESYDSIQETYHVYFRVFEIISVVAFTIEYGLRIWTSDIKYSGKSRFKARLSFMFTFMAIVDLLAILPFYLPMFIKIDLRFLRMVRITRLMRILKVNRYSKALSTIYKVVSRKKEELLATVFVMSFVIMISATLMYYFENNVQPESFPNIVASLWWAVATLTTVGYGDIYPVTFVGKILASIIAISGIGLVALPTGIISSGFVDQLSSKNQDNRCPHCHEIID